MRTFRDRCGGFNAHQQAKRGKKRKKKKKAVSFVERAGLAFLLGASFLGSGLDVSSLFS